MLEKNYNPSTGKPISPSLDTLKQLADAMEIDVDVLLKKLDENQEILLDENLFKKQFGQKKTVKIPLLGKVAAGEPIFAEENVEEYLEIDEELAKKGEFFALTIKGDSMFPYLLNDDILIVRKQDDVESGDIAVVLINGDEATVKQVFKNSDGIMLTAFNQQVWQPKTYTNEEIEKLPVKIIGRFAELRRRKFM